MAIDRPSEEGVEKQRATDAPPPPPPPPPDRPGAEDFPSRAESRAAAAAAFEKSRREDTSDSRTDTSAPEAATAEQDTSQDDRPEPSTARERGAFEDREGDAWDVPTGSDHQPVDDGLEQQSSSEKDFRSDAAGDEHAPVDVALESETIDTARPYADATHDLPGRTQGTRQVVEPSGDPGDLRFDDQDQEGLLDFGADGQPDQQSRREISGEGLPDDNARVADLDDDAVERGLSQRLKEVVARLDRGDRPQELSDTVDRPDFQDPKANPILVPDRYGTPLDRADGTRTPLFDGEPVREQTRQGALGDCGIIATLGAVAGHRPEAIHDCVQETDDGNYEVRLQEAKFSASRMRYEPTGRPITLTVTPDLPVFDKAPDEPAFADSTTTKAAWAPILEKAIAGTDQTWSDERRQKSTTIWNARGNPGDAPTGYVRLNQGSNPGDRAELLTQLTGQPARTLEFPTGYDNKGRSADKQLVDEFRQQLADRKPVLVGTRSSQANEPVLPKKLAASHAYEVTKVDDQEKIHLRNPWNRRHPDPLTIDEFKAHIRPRYTTLESS